MSCQVSWMPAARGHGDQVDGVVGRAAGGVQADDAVDDRALVDHAADRRVVVAERGDRQRPLGRFARQRVAQRRAGIDEGGARHVQAHDLHQHLVGVGGAVEGAGAGAVIGLRSRPPAVRRGRPCLRHRAGGSCAFSSLGRPEVIGPAGMKTAGRWPKVSAAITRPGTILSQTPRKTAASNMLWLKPDGRRHGDHVAREQRQLHARLALGDAVAHGRHAAGHLGDAAGLARRLLMSCRIGLERLMRRQHVVVGGDDAEVRHARRR